MATMVTVMDWQRTLLFTDGRFTRVLEPGRHRYNPRRDTVHTVDMRRRTTVVPSQELLTSDGATLRVSVLVGWQVTDPLAYLTAAASTDQELYGAVQIAVRDALAALTLDAVLADRHRLSAGLAEAAAAMLPGMGLEIASMAVRDLLLSGELRRAAADTLVTRERGRADLERARAEAASLRTLANAARLLEEHPSLLQLRTILAAATPGATIVLGRPEGERG